MKPTKIYAPVAYIFNVSFLMFIAISALLLFIVYGLIVSIIEQINWALRLSLSLQEFVTNLADLMIMFGFTMLFLIGFLIFIMVLNVSFFVREDGFRIVTFPYKSDWLAWDKIMKIRSFSYGEHRMIQIGIDGIGWIFKLNGFFLWMLPYGAINLGNRSIENGDELFRTFRRKRPDLF